MTVALITLAATGIFLTLGAASFLSADKSFPKNDPADSAVDASVSATNVGVFTDSACTVNCTSISAGSVTPGTSKNFTIHVKNMGTRTVTLSLATSDWNPESANGPIALVWDRDAYRLPAGASIVASLKLFVLSSISTSITSFSFNAAITGTE